MAKKAAKVIEGEDLNILVGSIPVKDKDVKNRVKQNILKILNKNIVLKKKILYPQKLKWFQLARQEIMELTRVW
jgi:hypothetical protein